MAVILISAIMVTGTRLIAPFMIGDDQAVQLEASQRLVNGLGLTTTKTYPRDSNDIVVAPPSKYLAQWPPGFSLLVATFLLAGVPLLFALKIIYGTITLTGWIGWATIATNVISPSVVYGRTASWIHLIIVALLPMVATPGWDGTDIFLWAGIPFLLMGLSSINKKQPSLVTIAGAGLLFGSLYALRFTSLFLGLPAALILLQVSYPMVKTFIQRFSVFLLSALTVMLPVKIYLLLYFERDKDFSIVTDMLDAPNGSLIKGFLNHLVVTSNLVFGHPILEEVVSKLGVDWVRYLSGIICLIVILAWPVVLWRSAATKALQVKDDKALSLSFLPFSLVLFLMAAGAYFGTTQFMLIRRYYEVVALCGLFISYELAAKRATFRIVKLASKGILLFFIMYVCLALPALASTKNGRDFLVTYASGFRPSRMFKLYTPRESARAKVVQLYRDNPDALFYATKYQWFVYDGLEGMPPSGTKMRAVPKPGFWRHAYTSRPVKIFWVLDQKTPLDFLPDPKKQLIFSDSSEQIEILVSDFPSGPLISGEQIAESATNHSASGER